MEKAILDFCHGNSGWFSRILADLPVTWIYFLSEIIPRLHFGIFRSEGSGLSCLCVPRMQRRVEFVLKPRIAGYFRCSNIIFHLLGSNTGYFFAMIRNRDSFPSTYTSSRWSYNCLEQLSLYLRVRCAFWELSEQGWHGVCKGLSYIFVHKGLPLYSVGLYPARLYRPCWFFQTQIADQQVVIGLNFCTRFHVNVHHWTEQVSWNYAKLNE